MTDKGAVFARVRAMIEGKGLGIAGIDDARPWGGFFVIDPSTGSGHARDFLRAFFPDENIETLAAQTISPKILIVAPGARLSWQYHHRRAELWRVLEGPVMVVRSATDAENESSPYGSGATLRLAQGERHRLIGADGYGIVAEIWQHTDPAHPSDENDIVRVQDDFGRR
jgi:mannose-6-phosphate isomerase-like protein (cupin superfamily)